MRTRAVTDEFNFLDFPSDPKGPRELSEIAFFRIDGVLGCVYMSVSIPPTQKLVNLGYYISLSPWQRAFASRSFQRAHILVGFLPRVEIFFPSRQVEPNGVNVALVSNGQLATVFSKQCLLFYFKFKTKYFCHNFVTKS